jgi:hypothetical protein
MKKRNALLIAIFLILAILILNAPDINYNRGPDDTRVPVYRNVASDTHNDALADNYKYQFI